MRLACISSMMATKRGSSRNSAKMGERLLTALKALQKEYPERIGCVDGHGLVAAVQMVKPGTTEPDADAAFDVVEMCVERGLLMFSPVGVGGGAIKISPPLCITAEQLDEGIEVLTAAMAETLAAATA